MHIRENSWHWKVYSSFTGTDYCDMEYVSRRFNFCKYARVVAFASIIFSILGAVGLFVLFSMASTWYEVISNGGFDWMNGVGPNHQLNFIQSIAAVGILFHVIGLICAIMAVTQAGAKALREKARARKYASAGRYEPKEPGFIATWYAANKEKFCPTVQFDFKPEPAE